MERLSLNPAVTATHEVTVTKGCPALGIKKGTTATITLASPGYSGVKVTGLASIVWCVGGRRWVPALKAGDTINFNSGDPTKRVTVTINK